MSEKIFGYQNAMQYDGTNAAAILAEIPASTISNYNISAVGGAGGSMVVSFSDAGPQQFTVAVGNWVVWNSYSLPYTITDEMMDANFVKISELP